VGIVTINSSRNNRIKYLRKLKKRKFRDENRKCVIEGMRFVEEALQSDWPVEALLCSADLCAGDPGRLIISRAEDDRGKLLLKTAAEKDIEIWKIPDKLMQEISNTKSPQGIMAIVTKPDYNLADIFKPDGSGLFLLVDGIQDPGNLGSIVRTGHAAGVDGVIFLENTVDLYNPKTLRSTAGSIFHVPTVYAEFDILLQKLKSSGIKLVVGDPGAEMPLWKVNFNVSTAIVVANEARGAREDVKNAADFIVAIPMPGKAESLNAAVSAGVLLYEVIRQRYFAKGSNIP